MCGTKHLSLIYLWTMTVVVRQGIRRFHVTRSIRRDSNVWKIVDLHDAVRRREIPVRCIPYFSECIFFFFISYFLHSQTQWKRNQPKISVHNNYTWPVRVPHSTIIQPIPSHSIFTHFQPKAESRSQTPFTNPALSSSGSSRPSPQTKT